MVPCVTIIAESPAVDETVNLAPGCLSREAMEEALQAAAEASGGDLTIEQVTKLHNEQVLDAIWYSIVQSFNYCQMRGDDGCKEGN